MVDASVVEAIRTAVAADPDNVALRTHLASLLLDAGDAPEALSEAEAALELAPDDAAVQDLVTRARAAMPVERETEEPVKLHAVRGGKIGGEVTEVERPDLSLADVGGMHNVKKRLRTAFLAPLENPALRRMYGKSLRGGLLLYGPPGCGKTFIARATAGELGARFIGVGLHDVLDMYLGESERKLHELFENARRSAPCVLFFDEVDALGRKRSHLRHSAGREVVVQFLSELDSFGSDNEGVFVLAATNHPWDVDTALRRPGRLDRMLLVLPPDQDAREAILEFHLRDRPVGDLDVPSIAARTDLYSGADLAHLVESAVEYALEDSVESGTARPILMDDLERALADIRPSTIPWLQTARNFAMYAAEGGAYDELIDYLREHNLT